MSERPGSYDALSTQSLRAKPCAKWRRYPDEVLPLWVADMDFPVAEPIKEAIRRYPESDNFGYPEADGLPGLKAATLAHLEARHGWRLEPQQLKLLSGIVPGLHLSVLALSSPGDEVLMSTPIYGPFRTAVQQTQRGLREVPLAFEGGRYRMDLAALEAAVTPATRILMLCNPHNPIGRVFGRAELEGLAELALRHRLWVVSDELHADLTFSGARHVPFASLGEEVGQRTLTLFGPTKAFNIAGLKIGFAASENPQLLERFSKAGAGLLGAPNVLAQAATIAAYREGGPWLERTLAYLEANRDFLKGYLDAHLPQVGFAPPEGTYLAWLDLRFLGAESAEAFLLENACLALNDGAWFGAGGAGFARLNFATGRAVLEEALGRLQRALGG